MKKVINKCGGRKSGCCADIILPYGVAKQKTDASVKQEQAGTKQTSN